MKLMIFRGHNLTLLGVCLLLFFNANAQEKGIRFQNFSNWEEVKKVANETNRPIFLDVYATWCGPCKWMDKEVYPNDSIGDFFNAQFMNVKVQMDSLKWDSPEIKEWYTSAAGIGKQYKITAFPTLLFLSPRGEIYKKIEGMRDVPSLIQEAKDALDPKDQYSTLLIEYQNGRRDPAFVNDLIRRTKAQGDKIGARKMAQQYIAGLSAEEMFNPENIWCIYENTKCSTDKGFAFLRDHSEKISQIDPRMGEKYTKSLVKIIVAQQAINPYRKDNGGRPNWRIILANIEKFGKIGLEVFEENRAGLTFDDKIKGQLKNTLNANDVINLVRKLKLTPEGEANMYSRIAGHFFGAFYKGQIDENKFVEFVNLYVKHPAADFGDGENLNTFAWNAGFEKFKSKSALKSALYWSRMSLVCNPRAAHLEDTYANLLYKLGEKEEAIIWESRLVDADPNNKEFSETFKKMQSGLPTWKE